jgi:RNA polymerase sigma-70 factor (ECF subfamily)
MADNDPTDGELLGRAGSDPEAAGRLFARYRQRLLRMVAVRMDRRSARRVDASDVVQEGFAEATRKLPEYLGRPEARFYPWLRQIVWRRLMDLYRRHVLAQRRRADQEAGSIMALPDESVSKLADRLAVSDTGPSGRIERSEARRQVRAALARLPPEDREVLILWYLEQVPAEELAAVLGITQQAVRHRHRRALERLGRLLRPSAGKEWES